jgi:hypothetical protein
MHTKDTGKVFDLVAEMIIHINLYLKLICFPIQLNLDEG